MLIRVIVDGCEAALQLGVDHAIRVLASDLPPSATAQVGLRGVLHVQNAWTGGFSTVGLEAVGRTLVAEAAQGPDNLALDAFGRLFVTKSDDGSVVEVLEGDEVRTLSRGGLVLATAVAALDRHAVASPFDDVRLGAGPVV